MRDLCCLEVVCCLGIVGCLGVISRLNFGDGSLPVDELGVKTERGSGVVSPRDGAVNTLEVRTELSSAV